MNKKAQGISMNVIIIAAIALLVLVVLSVIFIGRMGIFNTGVDCPAKGGTCQTSCDSPNTPVSDGKCGSGETCCKINLGT